MRIQYCVSGNLALKEEFETETVYKDVAKKMSEIPVYKLPVDVRVLNLDDPDEYVEYNISDRSGTQFVRETDNTMPDDLTNEISNKYLTCIDPDKNAYKKYVLCVDHADVGESESYSNVGDKKEFTAYWGRMATQKGDLFGEKNCTYQKSMFWPKYYEKIGKGYEDKTEFYFDSEAPKVEEPKKKRGRPRKISNPANAELFSKLLSWATNAVREAKINAPITKAIINESKRLLDEMRKFAEENNYEKFEKSLLSLMSISQRPVRTGDGTGVRRMLDGSYESIISREDDLIQAMEGVHTGKTVEIKGEFPSDIEVYEATEEQKEFVLKYLYDESLKRKVKKIYRVIPSKQQKAFDEYCKKNNITNIKYLWHGSRNQNWLSIVENSLKLNPNARINGKMFGYGIYFAPDPEKSFGYTSYNYSRWAHGNSDVAYMGLYSTGYGNPYYPSTSGEYKHMVGSKYNCVHAKPSICRYLCRDEIIYYDEAAICLQYIVEFN